MVTGICVPMFIVVPLCSRSLVIVDFAQMNTFLDVHFDTVSGGDGRLCICVQLHHL